MLGSAPSQIRKVTARQWYWHYRYPDHGDLAFDGRLSVELVEPPFGLQKLRLEEDLVARDDRPAELGLLNGSQQHEFGVAIRNCLQHQDAGNLRHCLHDQNAGHDRIIGEMPFKKRFVRRHVLDADDSLGFEFEDRIDEKKWITVGQNFTDRYIVQNGHVIYGL